MHFPPWKLVNQLQKQFSYTVWFYCVWPGHLISISSCWEQRVNFISSFPFMQTVKAAEGPQGTGSAGWCAHRMRESVLACLPASMSAPRRDRLLFQYTWGKWWAYFLQGQVWWHSFLLPEGLFYIKQTYAQPQFKPNKCTRGKKLGLWMNILERRGRSCGFHFCHSLVYRFSLARI